LLELPANYIENVKTNEIKFINAKIILLTSNKVTVKFCVNSDSHPDFCSYSNNMEQKCCQTIEINGKTVALSDITALEILQLILISIAILLIKFT
jgi:hypothetical protein